MATQASRSAARYMISPSVILLFIWMAVPLGMVLYYSFRRYRLLNPERAGWAGWGNYSNFVISGDFGGALVNTLILVVGVLIITVVLGILIAILIDQPLWGQGPVRILVISPFFIMPPVSALVWKNMFFNPTNGLFAAFNTWLGFEPYDFLGQAPLSSIIMIVSWEWLPFATLILLTALQSLDGDQLEAAEMDGASPLARFWYIMLPHMSRAITVVILIQTIFLLGIFGEILVTTSGGPGSASTTLPFLIFKKALLDFDVGAAAAGGVIAVILANIVAVFLMKAIGKNLD